MTLTAKSMDRSRSFESAIATPPFCRYYIIKSGVFQVKYSPCGECEIIPLRKLWNIAPSSQCEMKFAHIRVSEYFTFAEQIFHSEAISLARKGKFRWKKHTFVLVDKCVLFSGRGSKIWTYEWGSQSPLPYRLAIPLWHFAIISQKNMVVKVENVGYIKTLRTF